MADLDEVSQAIGRLAAMQEAHAHETADFRVRMSARLDKIESKLETWENHRNRILGGAAVIAASFGMVTPWIKAKLGL